MILYTSPLCSLFLSRSLSFFFLSSSLCFLLLFFLSSQIFLQLKLLVLSCFFPLELSSFNSLPIYYSIIPFVTIHSFYSSLILFHPFNISSTNYWLLNQFFLYERLKQTPIMHGCRCNHTITYGLLSILSIQ